MSELDNKLGTIIINAITKGSWSGNAHEEIAQIKAVFQEEGYFKPSDDYLEVTASDMPGEP